MPRNEATVPVISAAPVGKKELKHIRAVMDFAAQEARATHAALSRLGVPRFHKGEALSLSQRASWLEKRYLPDHRIVNDENHEAWREIL